MINVIRYVCLSIIIVALTGCFESSREAPPDIATKYGSKVVLYATSWCGYCEKTRELLKHSDIEYLEYDIESSAQGKQEFDKLGGKGIPLVLINGRVVEGYDPNAILELAKNT